MSKNYKNTFHTNPLVQDDPQDTVLYAVAVLNCLQHINFKNTFDDEAKQGVNLILETTRGALRFEAGRRLSKNWPPCQ